MVTIAIMYFYTIFHELMWVNFGVGLLNCSTVFYYTSTDAKYSYMQLLNNKKPNF